MLNKVNYINNQTVISADNLNNIQDEIIANSILLGKGISIDMEDKIEGKVNPVNADTLGGKYENELSVAKAANSDTLGGYSSEDFIKHIENKPKAGFIYPLASEVVPEGFLLCDGAAYSRSEYAELFAAIGTMYGNGDGSTTFNVPNLSTRVPVGSGEGYELGDIGGEANHTLTVNEMPKHDHVINIYAGSGSYGGGIVTYSGAAGASQYYSISNGGSQPHNNMQPYTVINYIITTGKDTGVSVADIIKGAQALPLGVEYGGTGATDILDIHKNLKIKATARNLLDNSDFRNPVNQRGQQVYTGLCYTIDRWIISGNAEEQNTMWISEDGYIGFSGGDTTENVWFGQRVPSDAISTGSKATFVVKQNGVETPYIMIIDSWGTDKTISFSSGISLLHYAGNEVIIYNGTGVPMGIEWAALYEGEYTAETLPEYQPKGYAAELAECLRYFERIGRTYSDILGTIGYNTSSASYFITSLPYYKKRIIPTILISSADQYRVLCFDVVTGNVTGASATTSIIANIVEKDTCVLTCKLNAAIGNSYFCCLQRADSANSAYIDISADL